MSKSPSHKPCDPATAYYCDSSLGPLTYDEFYSDQSAASRDFYLRCAQRYGGPVLEIGAGTGLVSWPIAKSGHEVVGIDISPRMLSIARSKAIDYDPSIRRRAAFHQANMVEFDLGRRFRTVIVPGRSFQHLLTPREQRDALTCIHQHLEMSGMMIMNLFDPKLEYCLPKAMPPKQTDKINLVTGMTFRHTILSRVTDPQSQTFIETMLLQMLDENHHQIREEKTQWSLRWTFQQEMRYLLELTGFSVERLMSDFVGAGPSYGKEQIWVCRAI